MTTDLHNKFLVYFKGYNDILSDQSNYVKDIFVRENGFYWVKFRGVLTVGSWFQVTKVYSLDKKGPYGYWVIVGWTCEYQDDDLDEIKARIPFRENGWYKVKKDDKWSVRQYINDDYNHKYYFLFDNQLVYDINIQEVGERIELP